MASSLSALLFTHRHFGLRLLAGQRVNNHHAKSTELLSRVLTSFERCQLPLLLNQAGLGVEEGRPEGGLGTSVSQGCGETGRAMDASRVESGNAQPIGNWLLAHSTNNV